MGEKVRKNEISLGQPGVVYILADGVIENLSCIEDECRMSLYRSAEKKFKLFWVVQCEVRWFESGMSAEVIPELLEFLQ